jgi:predicted adenylyl cyclase CyaB
MGFKNREKEIKLSVNCSYKTACDAVAKYAEQDEKEKASVAIIDEMGYSVVFGKSYDLYWHTDGKAKADFVRLRKAGNRAQITVKTVDKEKMTDRVEIDLEVDDYKQAKALLSSLYAEDPIKVSKRYTVYFLEDEHTNISIYQVTGSTETFIEIEAKTISRLKEITTRFSKEAEFEMTWIKSSIYDIFVKGGDPIRDDLATFLKGGNNG